MQLLDIRSNYGGYQVRALVNPEEKESVRDLAAAALAPRIGGTIYFMHIEWLSQSEIVITLETSERTQ